MLQSNRADRIETPNRENNLSKRLKALSHKPEKTRPASVEEDVALEDILREIQDETDDTTRPASVEEDMALEGILREIQDESDDTQGGIHFNDLYNITTSHLSNLKLYITKMLSIYKIV